MVALVLNSSCTRAKRTAPGETFSAGFVFPDQESAVTRDFRVINTTSRTVRISRVERSCSCASYRLENYELQPRGSTTLSMTVDVPKGYMQKSASCILVTDDPTFPNWTYSIVLTSLPFVVAQPDTLDLGSVDTAKAAQAISSHVNIDIYSRTKVSLVREDFAVPRDMELRIVSGPTFRKIRRDIWNTKYELSVGLAGLADASGDGGLFSVSTRAIELTAPGGERWSYPVYWRTTPLLACHPTVLNFGNLLDKADEHVRVVTLCCVGDRKFRILSISADVPGVAIDADFNSTRVASVHRVSIKMGACKPIGSQLLAGKIRIQTSETLQPAVDLPWSAMLDSKEGARPEVAAGRAPSVGR